LLPADAASHCLCRATSFIYFCYIPLPSLGIGKSTPNWRTFCRFLGILAYKSGWLTRTVAAEESLNFNITVEDRGNMTF
jgi:hypothetical protein